MRKNLGFSLIELMVAMALGIVLLLGVVNVFSSVRETSRLGENMSRLQENGRFGLDYMVKEIQQAGYLGPPGNELVLNAITPTGANTLDGGGVNADGLEINFAAERNCFDVLQPGFALKTVHFSWSNDVDPTAAVIPGLVLTCTYNGVAEINNQPLVDDIETLQFIYGVDADGDGAPNQYFNANNVPNWPLVVNVVVGIIATSPDNNLVLQETTLPSTTLLDVQIPPSVTGKIQKPFFSTVALRNRINL